MKTQIVTVLIATLLVVASFGQESDTAQSSTKLPEATKAERAELQKRGETAQKQRIKLPAPKQSDLTKQGNAAQKSRIKISDNAKSKLAQQGESAQQARTKLNSSKSTELTERGEAAQKSRIKHSPSTQDKLTKQGAAAQGSRIKLTDSTKSKLAQQGTAAQQTRMKLPGAKAAELTQRGEIAQKSRQATAKVASKPLKGILKNSNQASTGPAPKKQVTFNQQVQTKQIPTNPTKKLASGKATTLNKPVTSSGKVAGNTASKSKVGKLGKAAGAIGAAGIVAGGAASLSQADKDLKAGKITQSQYNKLQATNGVNIVGDAVKLKKLNPSALLLNDVVGTDPISLGIEGIGDIINGTDNAKQSIQNMEKAWNKSLVKQAFTDPKAAAERVGKDVEKFGRDAGKELDKAGKAIDHELKKAGQTIDRAANDAKKAIDNELKKAGNTVGKAAKDVENFFGKAFGLKK